VRSVRAWGTACFVGERGQVTLDVSPDLLRRQVTLVGSWTFSKQGQAECAEFIAERKVDVERLFTHRWRLEQAEEAYRQSPRVTLRAAVHGNHFGTPTTWEEYCPMSSIGSLEKIPKHSRLTPPTAAIDLTNTGAGVIFRIKTNQQFAATKFAHIFGAAMFPTSQLPAKRNLAKVKTQTSKCPSSAKPSKNFSLEKFQCRRQFQ
jgi:hypothetical protein